MVENGPFFVYWYRHEPIRKAQDYMEKQYI